MPALASHPDEDRMSLRQGSSPATFANLAAHSVVAPRKIAARGNGAL
jgi:hypothetical protein